MVTSVETISELFGDCLEWADSASGNTSALHAEIWGSIPHRSTNFKGSEQILKLLIISVWRSLVSRLVWDQKNGGSNPLILTNNFYGSEYILKRLIISVCSSIWIRVLGLGPRSCRFKSCHTDQL
jgi:hypothetical protein